MDTQKFWHLQWSGFALFSCQVIIERSKFLYVACAEWESFLIKDPFRRDSSHFYFILYSNSLVMLKIIACKSRWIMQDYGLLRNDAMQLGGQASAFRRSLLPPYSWWNYPIYQTRRRHFLEYRNINTTVRTSFLTVLQESALAFDSLMFYTSDDDCNCLSRSPRRNDATGHCSCNCWHISVCCNFRYHCKTQAVIIIFSWGRSESISKWPWAGELRREKKKL